MEEEKKIVIVGCGPGSPSLMTEAGLQAISDASVLAGAQGLLEEYAAPHHETIRFGGDGGFDITGLLAAVDRRCGETGVAILVSGDPGIGSLARSVIKRFGRDACKVIPGISSVQVAFARLGLDWTDARIVSAHREIPDLCAEAVSETGIVAILGGHRRAQEWIADLAEELGCGRLLVVCQDLSRPEERIGRVAIEEFRSISISSRTIVLIVKEELLP